MEKRKDISTIFTAFTKACEVVSRIIKAVWWVIKGGVCTFVNFNIWFLDKVFLGPPAIRLYLTGGLFPAGFSQTRPLRTWMRKNAGFDIYNKLYNGVFDNLVGGVLGCALFPVYTLMSHTFKSFWSVLKTNYNYINIQYSGQRDQMLKAWYHDDGRQRGAVAVLIGHFFSFYISLSLLIMSNLMLAFIKSFLSFLKPMSVMINYKWCDTQNLYEDERPIITKVMSGVFSVPILIPISVVTNIIYGCLTSLWHMLRLSCLFLNRTRAENKMLWRQDDRNKLARGFFGIINSSIWLPIAVVTNTIYGSCWSVMSMVCAFVPSMKAYRETTLVGRIKTEFAQDKRHWFSKGLFTFISSPISVLIILGCHTYQSMQLMWRVLGTYTTREAVEAAHQFKIRWLKDWRPLPFKLLGVLTSACIWIPVCLLSNLWLGCKEGLIKQLKIWYSATNRRWAHAKGVWNRYDRPRGVKYVFGFLTAPIWLPISLITNPIIGISTSLYYQARLWKGLVKPLDPEQDDNRPRCSRIVYGILSAPIWLPMHIAIMVSAVVTVLSTPLVFFFRKSFGTMYHAIVRATKPITDENLVNYGLPRNNFKSFVKGFLGLATVGVVPVIIKILKYSKVIRGYRASCVGKHILGLRSNYSGTERADEARPNSELIGEARIFNGALKMVRSGIFLEGKDWIGRWRILARMLGMRSPIEKILKLFHNAFIVYASDKYGVSVSPSMAGFQQCSLFKVAQSQALKASNGDTILVEDVLEKLQFSRSVV